MVLTALSLEYEAMRARLRELRSVTHERGTGFEIGSVPGTSVDVVVGCTGEGNAAAAVVAEQAIEVFRPQAVLLVGVAGALTDAIGLGDVVVATRVYAVHGGKEQDGRFYARPRAFEAGHALLNLAMHLNVGRTWRSDGPDGSAAGFQVHFKPVACGEAVLDSRESALAELVREHYNDAAAIEMESAGVAQAAHAAEVPMLTIRGISDRADGRKQAADAAGGQPRAAGNAAQVTVAAIRQWAGTSPHRARRSGSTPPATDLAAVRTALPLPRQLPAAVRDFTGRTTDLAVLNALLPTDDDGAASVGHPGAVVISAIDGSAGIGKTTLAVYWAHLVRDHFPDGTLYANLRGYGPGQPAEPGEVLEGFLRALGVPPGRVPASLEEQASVYRSSLDGRRVLIVLDNANAPAQVRPLLPGSAGCLVVVTSRSSLTGLVIGQGAARVSLDLLPLGEAMELLGGIVGAQRAAAEPQALAGIARACVRLPLALRIAGQRAAARPRSSLAEVWTELADERDRLEALSTSEDEASGVRAVFTWSYRVLPAERALMFRRLGLHPGTEISVHTATALADTSPGRARKALQALADVHLIEPVARDRYQMHDLLRAYALERVEEEETPQERNAAVQRLVGFYLHAGDSADRRLVVRRRHGFDLGTPAHPMVFDSDQQALDWFRAERVNLVAMVRRAVDVGLHDLAWQITEAVNGLFDRDGNRHDWIAMFRTGLASTRTLGDSYLEAWMLNGLCYALTQVRQFDEAIEYGERCVSVFSDAGDQAQTVVVFDNLGRAYHAAGQLDAAIRSYGRELEFEREHGDAWGCAIALNNLGEAYQDVHRVNEAIDHHRQAVETFRRVQDRQREAWSLRLLGDAYLAQGRLSEATTSHRQALATIRGHGGGIEEARALVGLGEDLHRCGDTEAAQECWVEALAFFDEIGDPQADDIRARLQS